MSSPVSSSTASTRPARARERVSTTITPSAKAHERVTGRWTRDADQSGHKEWLINFLKAMIGTPIPWLLWSYALLAFVTRAGVELAAWSAAVLTLLYVFVDRFSRAREFSFFRVGADFFLLGYVLVTCVGAAMAETPAESLATLGGARWVLLIYLMAYCFELFPGLNRLFGLMIGSATLAAAYGIWQHFTGVDLLRDTALSSAPIVGHVYFIPSSFFSTPELLGTLLVMMLPFPAAAYLMCNRKARGMGRWCGLLLFAGLGLGAMWTYRPGIWMAAAVSILILVILRARRALSFTIVTTALLAGALFTSYASPEAMFESVQTHEFERSERQRAQINTQVQLWQESQISIWVGVGRKALEAANYDPGTGNVYFQILAQSGVLGGAFYLLFILAFLLLTYRVFHEIPSSHYWHRVLMSGALASQIAFHVSGLYWSTLTEAMAVNVFVIIIASVSYLSAHYSRGLVPDDHSL